MRSLHRHRRPIVVRRSAFAGYRFPPDIILLAVRWYLRFGRCYRDVEELLAERGVTVDHVTIFRWVQRFTPELIDAARPCRHAICRCWFVDETYVRVAGIWLYVYRAVDQHGQVIDILVSVRRDAAAARRFSHRVLGEHARPEQVTTEKAKALIGAVREVLPDAEHDTSVYANNRVECDHGRLKARLRPMRGLRRDRTASVVIRGHAFVQNLHRRPLRTRRPRAQRTAPCRFKYSVVLRADGTVLTFGTNGAGQLGFANNVMPNPVPAPVMSGAVSVAAGDAHTVVLKADGTLWTFGANDLGQLGDPTTCCNFDPHPVPTQVLAGARSVAAGATHTVVVKSDGTVWTWGSGFFGELGRLVPFTPGGPDANPVPTQVMTGAVAAAAGRNFTVVLKADGTVWTFGFNSTGQLGRQTNGVSEQSVPTQVLSGVSAVAAGGSHTLALKVDGTVWTFGNNLDGQLGTAINVGISAPNVPTQVMSGVAAVSAGEYDTVVVKADGTVFTFGRNDFGQLGTPNVGHQPNPVPTQVASGAVAAAAGISHTLVLKADGTVLGFGHAGFGELAGSIDPPFDPAPRLTLAGAMIPGTVCQSKQDDHGGDKHKGRGKNHHERRDKHNRHDDDQCEGSD